MLLFFSLDCNEIVRSGCYTELTKYKIQICRLSILQYLRQKIYERYTEAEKTKSMLWMGYPFP